MRKVRLISGAAVALAVLASAGAARANSVAQAHELLNDWQVEAARDIAQGLLEQQPEDPAVLRLVARVKFEDGDYAGALKLLDKVDAMIGREGSEKDFLRTVVENAFNITKDYETVRQGRFQISYPKGKDAVLVPYALEAMEQAYVAFEELYDFKIPTPVRIEVYPGAEELAAATTLTVDEIKTSGTIAVCKFNRLMITSPKALASGYTWIDTLAHEYVHYVISKKSHNTLPIWLQEAFAKYTETAWRGKAGDGLRPASANLLAEALAKDALITFEQMSPSMAKLPSQEATATAFAEVFTVMDFIFERGGSAMANKIMEYMAAGMDDRGAVAKAVGMGFDQFEKAWLKWLRQQKLPTVPGAKVSLLEFKKSASTDEGDVEEGLGDLKNDKARRYLRLGEILRARGRLKASVMEYEKAAGAAEAQGEPNTHIQTKLGVAYLQAGEMDKAEATLLDVLRIEPTRITAHTHLGRLYFQKKDFGNAEHHYLMALRVNPFNPEIHMALHAIYKDGGQEALAERELQMSALLMDEANQRERPIERLLEGDAEVGLLTLYSVPWAEVHVDGKPTGLTTPVIDHELPAGKRTLELVNDSAGIRRKVEIEIPAGGSVRRNLDLAAR